jgi:hypothetical protein
MKTSRPHLDGLFTEGKKSMELAVDVRGLGIRVTPGEIFSAAVPARLPVHAQWRWP